MAEDQQRFVTYKALLMSLGTVLVVIIGIFTLYTTHMEKKVNRELYDRDYGRLCNDISAIKDQVDNNAKTTDNVKRNLELVLRHLKIEPVK